MADRKKGERIPPGRQEERDRRGRWFYLSDRRRGEGALTG